MLSGFDMNGAMNLTLCPQNKKTGNFFDCCSITATGPSSPNPVFPTPYPTAISGEYACGGKTRTVDLHQGP